MSFRTDCNFKFLSWFKCKHCSKRRNKIHFFPKQKLSGVESPLKSNPNLKLWNNQEMGGDRGKTAMQRLDKKSWAKVEVRTQQTTYQPTNQQPTTKGWSEDSTTNNQKPTNQQPTTKGWSEDLTTKNSQILQNLCHPAVLRVDFLSLVYQVIIR